MSLGIKHYLLKPINPDKLETIIRSIVDELNVKNVYNDDTLHSNAQEDMSTGTKTMKEILDYVDLHICEQVSLQSIADSMYINSSHLSRMFKNFVGKNYIDYVTEKRMKMAKKLLIDTNFTVYEIAEKLSYTDTKYFSNLFRKYAGMTPRDFRTKYKKMKL